MILYHSADLFWATRIKGTADALGIPARPVRSVQMLEARLADSDVRALVVDLDAPEVAIELIRRSMADQSTASASKPIRVIAYGPHVAVEAFAAAKAAGAQRVLARGAFSRHLAEWLAALDGPPEPGTDQQLLGLPVDD